jgi:hypothetical protein
MQREIVRFQFDIVRARRRRVKGPRYLVKEQHRVVMMQRCLVKERLHAVTIPCRRVTRPIHIVRVRGNIVEIAGENRTP